MVNVDLSREDEYEQWTITETKDGKFIVTYKTNRGSGRIPAFYHSVNEALDDIRYKNRFYDYKVIYVDKRGNKAILKMRDDNGITRNNKW